MSTLLVVVGLAVGVLASGRVADAQAILQARRDSAAPVAGVVLDQDSGRPVPGVHVELIEVEPASGRTRMVTAADGRFAFAGLPAGSLQLRARRVGYRPATLEVGAGEGRADGITVLLERAPAPLAGMVVTPGHYGVLGGVLGQQMGAPQTLTRDQITAAPQVGEDVFRLVGRLPGVAASDFSAAFRVRGGANEELLVTLDGLTLVEPYHLKDFDGALSIVDAGAVGGLELSTGGFGAGQGDRLTGLLDLRTREAEPGPPRTELALTLTALRGTSRGSFDAGRGGWLLSARLGFLDYALRMAGESRDDFHPRYGDLFGKVTWRPSPEHRLALHYLQADDRLRFQSSVDEPLLVSGYESGYLWGSWQAQLDERLEARTVVSAGRLGWNRQGDRYSAYHGLPDLAIRDRRRHQVVSARQDWSWAPVDRMLLTWGAELRHGTADYEYFRMQRYVVRESDRLVARQDTLQVALDPSATTLGLHLSQRVRPWSAVTAELGLRLDRQSHTGEQQLSPRASFALAVGKRTTVRAAWGDYAQAQGLHELQAQDGERAFATAERAEQRVVGVERDLGHRLVARVEAYDRRQGVVRPRWMGVDQALELLPEVGPDRQRIVPTSARARGLEVYVQRNAGAAARLTWSASYALASSEERVGGRSVPRPLDQRHTGSLDASYRFGDAWRLSGAWVYHSGWPSTSVLRYEADTLDDRFILVHRVFGPRNGDRQPGYRRVDLRVTRRFDVGGGRVTAFVDVFNLFDRRLDPGTRPRPPFDELIGRDRFDQWLPRVPSFGVTWEF